MVRALGAFALLALGGAAGAGAAGLPDSAAGVDLVHSFLGGDQDDTARAGRALGARGLNPQLLSPDRASALAAVAAAPSAEDAWEVLPALADLARGPDRPLAAAAARSAARIAADLDRDLALGQEVPTDYLERRLRLFRELAADPERWPDVRVHALEATAGLARSLPPGAQPELPFDLDAALADPDPELRRAALELLPHELTGGLRAKVAAVLGADEDPEVALAAAQVLCGELALAGDDRSIPEAAGEAGLARIEALVADAALAPLSRLEAARCVAGRPGARALLRRLAASLPPHLQPEARRLAGPGEPRR